MNKIEFIKQLSDKLETTEKEGKKIINAVIDVIRINLLQNEKILITGFGTFCVKTRSEREGKHPKTREIIKIPAKKIPSFKMSKRFKDVFIQIKKKL
ncbi:Nucleoid DNA-binding protein, similar to integration host factor (IHF) and HU [Candidatus Phytoplasma mali]|uniref:Nucleoid DNA-binding protein, similar to integration host factor (IHF) and HU n=1 Tax=Phytoplasma mali (strain AT) TaxID=482235 RepID=B3R0E2_PHYMT|nr:HU family DNA-binding protein [Candidatus Phytoplasma mali]CAP18306.1 Nucleoid DNA-binding protein, similar to integration host factor (IHF) and HU [Candidatus Phytoplasma mali]